MTKILPTIEDARQLKGMKVAQLEQLADEIRETLCNLLSIRTAHFASLDQLVGGASSLVV